MLEARSSNGPWEEFFARRVRGPAVWFREEDVDSAIGNYPAWIRVYDSLTRSDREKIRLHIARFKQRPMFSVLLPVYDSDVRWLRRAIESVRAQLYGHWELCIVDDASSDPRIWKLLQGYARRDSRIKISRRRENGHICAASNDALALATGEFVALLDHDDELAPTALYFAAHALDRDPALQLIYSDEDKLDSRGRRRDPHFKPDWNPDLFASQNYISHLGIYATALVRKIGGFRAGFEGSQDYDLTWRCVENIDATQIHHIPHVLYHWRMTERSAAGFAGAKSYAQDAALRAVQEHLDRSGIVASVEPHRGIYLRVRYPLPEPPPLVSIIIATRDRADFLQRCVESIFSKTDYPNFEIVVIDNESREPETLKYFAALQKNERVKIHRSDGAFNFSKLNNFGVARVRGVFVALLNNDLEVINGSWLSEMVSHGARPGIGAVGARLWYPNGTIQHAGVILGAGGIGSHAHLGLRDEDGYFSRPHLTQNLSAVTAACMLVRKEIYTQLGGLDEINLAVAFNDVDFCLRLRDAGYRIVWTPHAELFHHESASRGFEDTMEKRQRFLAEVKYMETKWAKALEADPAYNPNLSLANKLFALALPPRVGKPWETDHVEH